MNGGEPAGPAAPPPVAPLRADALFLLTAVAAAAAVRLDLLAASRFTVDSDEAVVGLMARHVLEGAAWPTFYYGQHYMGSFEPLVASLFFALFGASPAVLKSVPLVFSLVLVPVVYLLGLAFGGRGAARVAALLTAVPSSAFLEWSVKPRGGFIETVCVTTGALVLAARWLRSSPPPFGTTASVGALLGFGWWTNNQVLYAMVPVGILFSVRLLADPRLRGSAAPHAALGVSAFVAGGLPYWAYNLRHDWPSLGMFAPGASPWENLVGFVTVSVPVVLGAKRSWVTDDVFPGSSAVAAGVACAAGYYFASATRGRVPLTVRLLPVVFLATAAAAFVTSPFGSLYAAPRYLLPVYPVLYAVIGAARSRALAAAVLGLNLASCYLGGRAVPGEPFVEPGERVPRDTAPLRDYLAREGIRHVRTNYWIGYRLAFETGEGVTFAPFGDPVDVRIPRYVTGAAPGGDDPPLVLTPGQARWVGEALRTARYAFSREAAGDFVVFRDVRRAPGLPAGVPRGGVTAAASDSPGSAGRAVDGDVATRWGSGRPQASGMWFGLSRPRDVDGGEVGGVVLDAGPFTTDAAESLSVRCGSPEGRVLAGPEVYSAARRLSAAGFPSRGPVEVRFPPSRCYKVFLVLEGSDPVFDWSIAEAAVLPGARP